MTNAAGVKVLVLTAVVVIYIGGAGSGGIVGSCRGSGGGRLVRERQVNEPVRLNAALHMLHKLIYMCFFI